MRRKDLLTIVIVAVVITFMTVFAIFYKINNEQTPNDLNQEIEENREFYSNGWKKDIIGEIKNGIPIPVGFSYVEGKEKTGLVIKENVTEQEYMWIPYDENEEIYLDKSVALNGISDESKENIEEYNGFYVAIEDIEGKYNKYLRKYYENDEKYYELRQLGYERYKQTYEEQLGKKLDLNELTDQELEKLKILNVSRTDAVESHLMSIEEKALINKYQEKIGKTICLKDYKALTILSSNNKTLLDEITDNEWDTKIIANGIQGIPIPKGFEYVKGTKETGFKIRNGENLKFVWIPVEKSTEDVNQDGVRDTAQKIKNDFIKAAKASGAVDEKIELPSYEQYKDPDEDPEYKNLLESIEKYGGFYISEAELGYDAMGTSINVYRPMYERFGEGTGKNYVSDGDYYRNVDKDNIYYKKENLTWAGEIQNTFKLTYESAIEKCKELYSVSETVVSHLTYGLEYDATILYLLKEGAVTSEQVFRDSRNIGKYWTDSEEAKENLWYSNFELNGIYGLAGNLSELTRETDTEGNLILRGGDWSVSGNVQTLASKTPITEEDILSEEPIGTTGIRACLYIKTEYEDDVKETLEQVRKDILEKFENNINKIEVIREETNENIFNKNIPAVQSIISYVKTRVEEENSNATIEIVAYEGLEQIEQMAAWLDVVANYPDKSQMKYIYTWGPTKATCDKEKQVCIEKIKNLEWEAGKFKYEGQAITLESIATEAIKNIIKTRKEYREAIIQDQISNYPTGAEKEYVSKIKEIAKKGELSGTENFDKLNPDQSGNFLEKWQYIIEQAVYFDNTYSKEKEYHDDWIEIKNKYLNLISSEEFLKQIATETVTKEEVEALIKKEQEKAEDEISSIIMQKQEEKRKTEEEEEEQKQQQQEQTQNDLDKILSSMTLEEKIYQMFFVTPEAITKVKTATAAGEATKTALQKYPVGGIIYFEGNIQNATQISKMISNSQSYSKIPLFIGVDEEGGTVTRLSKKISGFPNFGNMSGVKNTEEAYNIGSTLGSELKKLGFNLDFAPVADVITNSNNTVVKKRSFGSDGNLVANMVSNFVKGMESKGVSSLLKHFPGHGSTAGDTHNGVAATDRTMAQLQSAELIPFKKGIEAGSDFVMMAHITLTNIDSSVPATFSKKIVTELLKNEIGFNGVVITDAMNMGAIVNQYTVGEAAVKAIQAGCDMILMPANIDGAHSAIKSAVQNGTISEQRINESVKRILRVKKDKIW